MPALDPDRTIPTPVPEGDTIHRAARHLRRALVGRPVRALSLRDRPTPEAIPGRPVQDVEARGKNLLVRFEPGWVLYTHMKMTGSWHIYRPGESWRKNPRWVVARIDNEAFSCVCFNAPVVELLTDARARRHPTLARLGPDLLAHRPDLPEMVRRLRTLGDLPLGVALLDQRALAGIGNVYKSELCFLSRLDPFAPVAGYDEATLLDLLRRARRSMLENMDTFRRTTRRAPDGERHWVYGRVGAPCHRCGDAVQLRRQGDAGRSTYFCPRCQPPPERPGRLAPR